MARREGDIDPEEDARQADLRKARELVEAVHETINSLLRGADGEISPGGNLFLEWLCLVSGANRSSFHAKARVHAYREGRRSLAYEVFQFLHLTPEQIMLLRERKYLR